MPGPDKGHTMSDWHTDFTTDGFQHPDRRS
jgi:hypothetical protein